MPIHKHCDSTGHSPLLDEFLPELKHCNIEAPILDLACGNGRNGLFLARQGLGVTFADKNQQALAQIKANQLPDLRIWPVDLELDGLNPLACHQFGAILVFRYLHRALFESIKKAVKPGGMVIYETFTTAQAELGRPKNPNFLLKPEELKNQFADWQIKHYFEGMQNGSAMASIVAINL